MTEDLLSISSSMMYIQLPKAFIFNHSIIFFSFFLFFLFKCIAVMLITNLQANFSSVKKQQKCKCYTCKRINTHFNIYQGCLKLTEDNSKKKSHRQRLKKKFNKVYSALKRCQAHLKSPFMPKAPNTMGCMNDLRISNPYNQQLY